MVSGGRDADVVADVHNRGMPTPFTFLTPLLKRVAQQAMPLTKSPLTCSAVA